MRVLLFERDQSIELMLKPEEFYCYTTDDEEEAEALACDVDYDIVLLDPAADGSFGLLKRLKTRKVQAPIVVLSGFRAVSDLARAFSLGADDYLTKPFHKEELVARIHAIVRRARGYARSVVHIGDLTLDLTARSVQVEGRELHLTGKEYQILELLALRKGRVLTKDNILDHLYGGMDEPESKIVDVYICKLRGKLGQAKSMIETLWGRGYVLREPASAPQPLAA